MTAVVSGMKPEPVKPYGTVLCGERKLLLGESVGKLMLGPDTVAIVKSAGPAW